MYPKHYENFKRSIEFYPGERIGSWVSDNDSFVYYVELDESIGDSVIHKPSGEMRLADFLAEQDIDTKDLICVGTYGANASPGVIKKFDGSCSTAMVTIKGTVLDKDCVYESRISQRGLVPFTMIRSEGTMPDFYVNLLTTEQLKRMHITEGCKPEKRTYELGIIDNVALQSCAYLSGVYLYVATGKVYIHPAKNSPISC